MSPTSKVRWPGIAARDAISAVSMTLDEGSMPMVSAGHHALRQTGGDRPRSASDVEQPHARLEERKKERSGHDLRRPLGVVGDHRGVMTMLVGAVKRRSIGHQSLLRLRAASMRLLGLPRLVR